MKKHFILSALTIFLSSISLGLTSCNFSTAKKLKTIQVNNSSQYGTIELEKYEGLVNEEINGSISAKSGYKVEYVLFNNEFIEIQGTGEQRPFSQDELEKFLFLAKKGINSLIADQKSALGIK